jgi:hypothetical protein
MRIAKQYLADCNESGFASKAEIICTGVELPTMKHQEFWISYLQASGALPSDWIFWLAYDDQLRLKGIQAIATPEGSWHLSHECSYFGPWAVRHEKPEVLWAGRESEIVDSWTSFPLNGPTRLHTVDWVTHQIKHPTYMQMSGSICTLDAHTRLAKKFPRKFGPMRIELATALSSGSKFVEELSTPVTVVYGRGNSDRANYAKTARREDFDLVLRLSPYLAKSPRRVFAFALTVAKHLLLRRQVSESWDVREFGLTP